MNYNVLRTSITGDEITYKNPFHEINYQVTKRSAKKRRKGR